MKILPSAALALLLLPSAARAEGPPAPSTESDDRFHRGVKSFEAGKYEAALLEFEAAYAASPQNGLLYNVAVTQRKLGRMGDALKSFDRYLKGGGDAISP